MKALLAACIAGAIAFSGVIYLVGGNTPGVTVPDVMPVATPEVAVSFEPAVPGRFPMPGFPDDRASLAEPSHSDAAPDAGAGKAAGLRSPPWGRSHLPNLNKQQSLARCRQWFPDHLSWPRPTAVTALSRQSRWTYGHRDAAQLAPTNCDASGRASSTEPQDFRYLICYVWSELPPAEKPAATVLRSFKDIRSERRSRRSSARPTHSASTSLS